MEKAGEIGPPMSRMLGGARRNRIMNVLSSRAAKNGEPRVAETLIASRSSRGGHTRPRNDIRLVKAVLKTISPGPRNSTCPLLGG